MDTAWTAVERAEVRRASVTRVETMLIRKGLKGSSDLATLLLGFGRLGVVGSSKEIKVANECRE